MIINNWTQNNKSTTSEWHLLEEIEKNIVVTPYLPLIVPYLPPFPVGPRDASNCTVPFASFYLPPGDSSHI